MTSIKLSNGFSLIEVIIASGLFALTFTASLKLYQQIFGQWQQLNAVQQAQLQLETAQVDLLINVNTNSNSYDTLTPSYPTNAAKAITLVQEVESLPKLTHTDEPPSEGSEEATEGTTEDAIHTEQELNDELALTEEKKPTSSVITQQLTFVVAPPYQSNWQDVVNMGPLAPLTLTTP